MKGRVVRLILASLGTALLLASLGCAGVAPPPYTLENKFFVDRPWLQARPEQVEGIPTSLRAELAARFMGIHNGLPVITR